MLISYNNMLKASKDLACYITIFARVTVVPC